MWNKDYFNSEYCRSMKKMQKEMKDVELQLGIVANQVQFQFFIHYHNPTPFTQVVYQFYLGFAARQKSSRKITQRR